ncbi:hypothetical protein GSY74_06640 [Sulfurovum sp. bin170]|uniref:hypothetical protein n=1 Tax=Sulfurovum sp. bin170 TaxID=2695268 RepID=UPI0013DFA663|nr:hypothetical protein [Sulfurovum sp. bin170]NEW60958.1 hypothetical protein [Sulfurovum sp. bin170]
MKKIFLLTTMALLTIHLSADSSDWEQEEVNFESENSTFEKMKIKNRSKKEYDDKIYKYIKGDYKVENNNIELATIELDDSLKNRDIEINVHVEDLQVEGDGYKDSMDIKQNKYKNFVQNDEKGESFFDEEEKKFDKESDIEENSLQSSVRVQDSRQVKVIDEDLSELETIDLRGNRDIKEVNVFIEDTRIIVD